MIPFRTHLSETASAFKMKMVTAMLQTKFLLDESEIPTHWYNVVADMPNRPVAPRAPTPTTRSARR
jgi:hypothetical protein